MTLGIRLPIVVFQLRNVAKYVTLDVQVRASVDQLPRWRIRNESATKIITKWHDSQWRQREFKVGGTSFVTELTVRLPD